MTKPTLESQVKRDARLLEGAMFYGTLFLIVLISFTALYVWSAGQPDPSAYLPRWLTADPAPEAVLPKGDWR